jgi:hypothetical protein
LSVAIKFFFCLPELGIGGYGPSSIVSRLGRTDPYRSVFSVDAEPRHLISPDLEPDSVEERTLASNISSRDIVRAKVPSR